MLCSVAQSCQTLCDPKDCSPPGSSVHGISQARTLEWVATSPPGDLPNPGIEPVPPASVGGFFTTAPPGKLSVEHSLLYLAHADLSSRHHSLTEGVLASCPQRKAVRVSCCSSSPHPGPEQSHSQPLVSPSSSPVLTVAGLKTLAHV